MTPPGKHYLRYPDSFAAVNGVLEHPAGTPVTDFATHMKSWCSRVLGHGEVPGEYEVLGRTLKALGNAKATFTPSRINESVILTITTNSQEVYRGTVFHVQDSPAWFGVAVRVACRTVKP